MTTHHTLALVATLVSAVAVPPRFARASEPVLEPPDYASVWLADSFADDGKLVRAWANDATVAGLRKAEIDAGDVATGRVLVVELRGREFKYEILVGVRQGEEWLAKAEPVECKCNPDELVERLTTEVAAVAPKLEVQGEPATEPVPPPTTNGGGRAPADVGAPPRGEQRRPLAAGGKAGVALLAVGGAATIAGVVLLALPPQQDLADDPERTDETSYRPVGGAVLGVGLAAVITGAVLLGIDRKRARSRSAALLPMFGPRSAGFVLSTRF